VIVTSFLDEVVHATRQSWPEIETALVEELASPRGNGPAKLLTRARACGAPAVAVEHALVLRDGLEWAEEAGLAVYVWTVNDVETMQALLVDPRVAGIITDIPRRAVEVRAQLGGAR
jgi:glycerophosphoryl diester phosphodiesterase